LRVTRDLGARWDVGAGASTLHQTGGVAALSSLGLEGGRCLAPGVWVSMGYNWTGFFDRDLSAADYTQRGLYLRLRVKFDESLLTKAQGRQAD
jgi:hypothetical protein